VATNDWTIDIAMAEHDVTDFMAMSDKLEIFVHMAGVPTLAFICRMMLFAVLRSQVGLRQTVPWAAVNVS
jgi:hypothetical protein